MKLMDWIERRPAMVGFGRRMGGESTSGSLPPPPQAIAPPDFETRVAILISKANASGVPLDEQVAYFIANVIRGPLAFVETTDSYDDYARAMKRKLLRELAPNLSRLDGGAAGARPGAGRPVRRWQ